MVKTCLKCGYQRKPGELVPETECPKCGVIYAKAEQALRKTEAPEPPPEKDPEKPPTAEERSAELTAYLSEQTRLNRERTRTFGFAITVIPSAFFGLGLFFACEKMFGPLIIIAKVINSQGIEGWTIVFPDNPIAWAIIVGGVLLPFLFLWYRNVRRSLRE
ncbi:hypothetical protein UZ36_04935 [Candidatus Nitromaritima sp. SCGC AAA799-C22]|nr:hypothetical protein UZ36_04935 [Candidatus Nitromaritima sp. SCGC AAA799-C22]